MHQPRTNFSHIFIPEGSGDSAEEHSSSYPPGETLDDSPNVRPVAKSNLSRIIDSKDEAGQ